MDENESLEGNDRITLDFTREELYKVMYQAHLHDLTLNEYCNKALAEFFIANGDKVD
jgi:hypothetical protein